MYVGAASDDKPEYFSICLSAMEYLGVRDCHMVSSCYHHLDRSRLKEADIIVLGGGEVGSGWRVLEDTGMARDIRVRYSENATVIGVSAGAVHMGLGAWADVHEARQIINTLALVPFFVDVHDEGVQWSRLRRLLSDSGLRASGLALPMGSGVVVHQDASIEPLEQSILKFRVDGNSAREVLLLPPSGDVETRSTDDGCESAR